MSSPEGRKSRTEAELNKLGISVNQWLPIIEGDAQLDGKPIPLDLNPDIVYERHYALNWLTCYEDEWDNVPTDT